MAVLAKRNRRQPEPEPGLELAAQTLAPMLARMPGARRSQAPESAPGATLKWACNWPCAASPKGFAS